MTEKALAQTTTTARSAAWADTVDRLSATAESILGVKPAVTAARETP